MRALRGSDVGGVCGRARWRRRMSPRCCVQCIGRRARSLSAFPSSARPPALPWARPEPGTLCDGRKPGRQLPRQAAGGRGRQARSPGCALPRTAPPRDCCARRRCRHNRPPPPPLRPLPCSSCGPPLGLPQGLLERIREELTCVICFEVSARPATLPCGHSACRCAGGCHAEGLLCCDRSPPSPVQGVPQHGAGGGQRRRPGALPQLPRAAAHRHARPGGQHLPEGPGRAALARCVRAGGVQRPP